MAHVADMPDVQPERLRSFLLFRAECGREPGNDYGAGSEDGRTERRVVRNPPDDFAGGQVETAQQMQFRERVGFWNTAEFRLNVEPFALGQLDLQHSGEEGVRVAVNEHKVSNQPASERLAVKHASRPLRLGVEIDEGLVGLDESDRAQAPRAVKRPVSLFHGLPS